MKGAFVDHLHLRKMFINLKVYCCHIHDFKQINVIYLYTLILYNGPYNSGTSFYIEDSLNLLVM